MLLPSALCKHFVVFPKFISSPFVNMKTKNDGDISYNERTPILSSEESSCSSGSEYYDFIQDPPKLKKGCIQVRYVLTLLGCLGFVLVYAMRVNMNVAVVAMVPSPHISSDSSDNSIACSELFHKKYQNNSLRIVPQTQGEFDWDSNTQAFILGSFYYGYVISQIPGGILAERFGAKWLYGLGILVTAVFTLLTPLAARWNVWALVIVRAIEGLGEGVTFPAMNVLIGRWVPKMQRSRLATFIYTGCPIGTVIALTASGLLSASDFLGGWPAVFYVFGVLGCIWFIFWATLVYESPDEHPRISKEELQIIHDGLDQRKVNLKTPWKSILTSVPVWALVVTHFGQNWGFYTLLTELPTYMANILHFNIKKNGLLSSFPYLSQAVCAIFASFLADYIRKTSRFRITSIRKIMNSIAFFGPAISILCVVFVGCHPVAILILLTLSLGFNGFMYSGFNVTHVDMSPAFAGTLMGLTNCIANFSGFLAPAFVGKVIEDGQTVENWSIVFITTSSVYFLTGIIYNAFGSAELQPWGRNSSDLEHFTERRNDDRAPSSVRRQISNF